MALKIKHGDLFKYATSNCIIAHGCNAQGVMGSGFAKQVKERFPGAYEAYMLMHKSVGLSLGDWSHWEDKINNIIIFNIVTQVNYGRDSSVVYADFDTICRAMCTLAFYQQWHPDKYIHIPLIGGGLANGNKAELTASFVEIFRYSDATLWLH